MKFQSFRISVALAAFGAAVSATAQLASAGHASAPAAPYTAEFKITRVQTLANGATITHESKQVMARDSQGRSMNANTPLSASDDQPGNTITMVHNPVDNTQITWDSRSKHVRVLKMAPPGAGPGCWSTASGNSTEEIGGGAPAPASGGVGGGVAGSALVVSPSPDSTLIPAARPMAMRPVREDLGTDTILGTEVKGTRITRTIPAGQIGNDVPLVTTSEIWSAPSLGLTLREITDSAQSGKSTREAVSLDLGEPDPSLFQPPEGYEVTTAEMHPAPCRQGP